jgi:tRNA-2-methylthio-N6-dimethylallyladenosine synthase
MCANTPKLYIETYGCQMNVSDSEIAAALLQKQGFEICKTPQEASVILINTCAIREGAEQRIWGRLAELRSLKSKNPLLTIGVIGCMAERLKQKLIDGEHAVDIVAGPDSYRQLAQLVEIAQSGQKGINVELSREETYTDIAPVRYGSSGVTAFVSIMRGCNNMCSYCVVPYTRGAERSRPAADIVGEVLRLAEQGYKEVTLLGQNVNSYCDKSVTPSVDFAELLCRTADTVPAMRIRFATSHPKDISEILLLAMTSRSNICRSIHLPVQSGSNRILELMNRRYTREDYLRKIDAIRRIMPDAAISTDIIAGFCTETEADHRQTLQLMRDANYDFAYMFMYSERPNTRAARTLKDDVPTNIKTRRLNEIIAMQNSLSLQNRQKCVSKVVEVLAEGFSKKSQEYLFGRTPQYHTVVFPRQNYNAGDYVQVRITHCTSATLMGEANLIIDN